jgi:hypothetical protein
MTCRRNKTLTSFTKPLGVDAYLVSPAHIENPQFSHECFMLHFQLEYWQGKENVTPALVCFNTQEILSDILLPNSKFIEPGRTNKLATGPDTYLIFPWAKGQILMQWISWLSPSPLFRFFLFCFCFCFWVFLFVCFCFFCLVLIWASIPSLFCISW